LPAKILRLSAAEISRLLSASIAGLTGPSGVSGGEHHLVGAEEIEAAVHRMDAAAKHGCVAVELAEIIEVRALQRNAA
jgi:hypothetical protein